MLPTHERIFMKDRLLQPIATSKRFNNFTNVMEAMQMERGTKYQVR